MGGRIPNNYEESKQWIDVYNNSEVEIRAFGCAVLMTGLVTDPGENARVDNVVIAWPVESLNTGFYYLSGGGLRTVAVCGAVPIKPKAWGRVSQDWPLLARVDGRSRLLSEIAKAPVFPADEGFSQYKSAASEPSLYGRGSEQFYMLSYPEGKKSGICWVVKSLANDESALRMTTFTVEQEVLGPGYSPLNLISSDRRPKDADNAVVDVVDGKLKYYSFGHYDLFMNLQLASQESWPDGTLVPGGVVSLADEQTLGELPDGGEVQVSNPIRGAWSLYANIAGLNPGSGVYACSDVKLIFAQAKRVVYLHAILKLRRLRGSAPSFNPVERTLMMTQQFFSNAVTDDMEVTITSGHGYVALRSENVLL